MSPMAPWQEILVSDRVPNINEKHGSLEWMTAQNEWGIKSCTVWWMRVMLTSFQFEIRGFFGTSTCRLIVWRQWKTKRKGLA